LIFLALTFAVATMDRQILAILQDTVKHELHLSDGQLGLLTGFSFALFYSAFGIPVGMLADRWPRRIVLAISMIVWSVMTALASVAPSFTYLLLTRIGVGIGEAGVTPASALIIAERYSRRHRAGAMSFFYVGPPLGMLLGFFLGSRLAHTVGWRMTFLLAGLPAIFLAVLLLLLIREPTRSIHSEPILLKEGLRNVAGYKTLRRLAVAAGLSTIVAIAPMSWGASYLIRLHGMSVIDVGTSLGLAFGIGGVIGNFGTGLLVDRLTVRDVRWYVWLPAVTTIINGLFIWAALMASSGTTAVLCLLLPCALGTAFNGVVVSVVNMIAPPRFRGAATALYVLSCNLVGNGIGAWLIGIASDMFAPTEGAASIKYALLSLVPCTAVLAAMQYVLASRTLRNDLLRSADDPFAGTSTSAPSYS
jgi:predicted MFS family arabinose efflux permease